MIQILDDRKREIREQLAKVCNTSVEHLEDAYPCPEPQAEQFTASTQAGNLLHFNFVYALTSSEPGAIELLKRAINAVCSRNPILRSKVVQLNDKTGDQRTYYAVLRQGVPWNIFSDLELYCKDSVGKSVRSGDALSSFAISADRTHFVWTIHHSLYDGWSLGLLAQEIGSHLHAGKILSLPPRPSYSKFIASLRGPPSDTASEFWADSLRGYYGPVLKSSRSLPTTNIFRKGKISVNEAHHGKRCVAERIQAAWALALLEWFQAADIMFLTYSTGRNCLVDGVSEMTGPCLCIVPLRAKFDPADSVKDFIDRVGSLSRLSLEHEHAGLQALRKEVQPDRRPNHVLNITPAAQDPGNLPGMELQNSGGLHKKYFNWVAHVSVGEEEMQWSLCADEDRLPVAAVDFLCRRFPELILSCMTIEEASTLSLASMLEK